MILITSLKLWISINGALIFWLVIFSALIPTKNPRLKLIQPKGYCDI